MSKCWSCECSALGLCGGGPQTRWCEENPGPGGGCTGGDVGAPGIMAMTPAQIEASTTKFWGTRDEQGNLVLQGVGFLATAGMREGDVLVSVNGLAYNDEKHRQTILRIDFPDSKQLTVAFRYGRGKVVEQSSVIANPAYSLPRDPKEET